MQVTSAGGHRVPKKSLVKNFRYRIEGRDMHGKKTAVFPKTFLDITAECNELIERHPEIVEVNVFSDQNPHPFIHWDRFDAAEGKYNPDKEDMENT